MFNHHFIYTNLLLIFCLYNFFQSKIDVTPPDQITQYYVSEEGNDNWTGLLPSPNADSSDGPFASLEKAIQIVRSHYPARNNNEEAVVINLRAGKYVFYKTLLLDSLVSGTSEQPLIIQNYQDEDVHLIGGIKVEGFQLVTQSDAIQRLPINSRDSVWEINLKSFGINNFGELTPRGFPRPVYPSPLELYFNFKPMQLARWPNQGWARINKDMGKSHKDYFNYTGQRPKNWLESEDIWLHGFWGRDWADSYTKVKYIDTINHKIETYEPHGTYGYAPNGRYYALNLLEELDQPGEWYMDRKTGILYFWPPSTIKDNEVYLSILESPLIQIENASYLHIHGFIFEIARGNAVVMNGGKETKIEKSVFRNTGNHAIELNGGNRNGVVGCDFYNLGEGGIILSGGDRSSLIPANNYVVNCYFHHYNRWVMSSKPAIFVHGVGNRVQHNVIHDAPQGAIHLTGNEHLIEYNEIFRMGEETGDIGAFYMGRDFSMQKNIIRYNYFHDMESPYKYGVKTVYLDDFVSGTEIYGNIFYQVQQGVLVNGGSHNLIENNIFIDSKEAVRITHRSASSYKAVEPTLVKRLESVNYSSDLWTARYPQLENILKQNPGAPLDNTLRGNECVSCNHFITIRQEDKGKQKIVRNKTTNKISFTGNLLNLPESDRKNIPVEKIGLYRDSLRVSWPIPVLK